MKSDLIERVSVVVRRWIHSDAFDRPEPARVPDLLREAEPEAYEALLPFLRDMHPFALGIATRAAADNLRVPESARAWFAEAMRQLYDRATTYPRFPPTK